MSTAIKIITFIAHIKCGTTFSFQLLNLGQFLFKNYGLLTILKTTYFYLKCILKQSMCRLKLLKLIIFL